jgi:hypothetical protein
LDSARSPRPFDLISYVYRAATPSRKPARSGQNHMSLADYRKLNRLLRSSSSTASHAKREHDAAPETGTAGTPDRIDPSSPPALNFVRSIEHWLARAVCEEPLGRDTTFLPNEAKCQRPARRSVAPRGRDSLIRRPSQTVQTRNKSSSRMIDRRPRPSAFTNRRSVRIISVAPFAPRRSRRVDSLQDHVPAVLSGRVGRRRGSSSEIPAQTRDFRPALAI